MGYGLLGLSPDELFSLTMMEFVDMYSARVHYDSLEDDREYARTAWFTSLIMSSTGNYGKKGVDPKKIYTSQYDADGNLIEDKKQAMTPIAKEVKEQKLRELLGKFNKDYDEVTKGE